MLFFQAIFNVFTRWYYILEFQTMICFWRSFTCSTKVKHCLRSNTFSWIIKKHSSIYKKRRRLIYKNNLYICCKTYNQIKLSLLPGIDTKSCVVLSCIIFMSYSDGTNFSNRCFRALKSSYILVILSLSTLDFYYLKKAEF